MIEVLLDETITKRSENEDSDSSEADKRRTNSKRSSRNKRRSPASIRTTSRTPRWLQARILDIVTCNRVRYALDRVSTSGSQWTGGWPVSTDAIGQLDVARAETAASSFWNSFEDIILLEIIEDTDDLNAIRENEIVAAPLLPSAMRIDRGLPIRFVGSPYGILAPNIFHNSVFDAIISNVVALHSNDHRTETASDASDSPNASSSTPHEADLLMIDQECQPGCEGGPVFDSKGDLVGMMLPPIRPTDGTTVQVQLVAPANQFVHSVRAKMRRHFGIDESEVAASVKQQTIRASNCVASEESLILSAALQSVVLVSVGSYWASGVVISTEGDIITSAHLFKPILASENPFQPTLKIGYRVDVRLDRLASPRLSRVDGPPNDKTKSRMSYSSSMWLAADLCFVSDSHLDVALIRLSTLPTAAFGILRPIQLPKRIPLVQDKRSTPSPAMGNSSVASSTHTTYTEPQKGDQAYVIGYSLFGPSKKLKATCTEGIVSGLPRVKGRIQMVQTSCKVDKGASGGAVIDRLGNFLGLVTCNAVTKKGVVISRINFSIPLNQLVPIFRYTQQRNAALFEPILGRDEEAKAMWKITQTADLLLPPYIKEKHMKVLEQLKRTSPELFQNDDMTRLSKL